MNDIFTIILTSTLISSLVTFFLNYFFENRQKHRFDKEITQLQQSNAIQLELLKAQIAAANNVGHELSERRIDAYPLLVELIYRTRNIARELTNSNISKTFIDESIARTAELEDRLYKFRIDLERDHVFTPIHAYKNLLRTFNLKLQDIDFYQNANEMDKVKDALNEIKPIYSSIEDLHKEIIEKLSVIIGT